jgi:hypothetical protein
LTCPHFYFILCPPGYGREVLAVKSKRMSIRLKLDEVEKLEGMVSSGETGTRFLQRVIKAILAGRVDEALTALGYAEEVSRNVGIINPALLEYPVGRDGKRVKTGELPEYESGETRVGDYVRVIMSYDRKYHPAQVVQIDRDGTPSYRFVKE